MAGDVASASCARAICIQSLMHGLQDFRVSTHTQIVVGAPDRYSLVALGHVGLREFLSKAIDVVEVSVGLVLMLLLKFSIVKALIIELRHGWSSRFRTWRSHVWLCRASGLCHILDWYYIQSMPCPGTLRFCMIRTVVISPDDTWRYTGLVSP